MKLMRRLSLVYATFLVFFFMISPCFAASTFTADIEGLTDPSNIGAITFWFDVEEDFSFSNFALGDAVPTIGTLGWEVVKGTGPDSIVTDPERGLVYKIDAYDQDDLYFDLPNNLTNGTIFTFQYEGSLNGFTDVVVLRDTVSMENLVETGVITYSFDESGVHFSAVPIPSALLLLGSGLIGLVGITRRTQSYSQ